MLGLARMTEETHLLSQFKAGLLFSQRLCTPSRTGIHHSVLDFGCRGTGIDEDGGGLGPIGASVAMSVE
jgi:hypothetical protein